MAREEIKVPKLINAFTARTHLGRLIRQVSEKGETYVLTKKGKPKVVLMGVEEYQDLLRSWLKSVIRSFRSPSRSPLPKLGVERSAASRPCEQFTAAGDARAYPRPLETIRGLLQRFPQRRTTASLERSRSQNHLT